MAFLLMAEEEQPCHIPKKTEKERAVQPFTVRDGVGLDHLRQGHKNFNLVCCTCNMMQMRLTDASPSHTVQDDSAETSRGLCWRR